MDTIKLKVSYTSDNNTLIIIPESGNNACFVRELKSLLNEIGYSFVEYFERDRKVYEIHEIIPSDEFDELLANNFEYEFDIEIKY